MTTGIIIGFGAGLTAATLIWSWLLISANRRGAQGSKRVEALLERNAASLERIAAAAEQTVKEK